MLPSRSLFTIFLFGIGGARAAFKPPVNGSIEHGVATECKSCPYSLCTNKQWGQLTLDTTIVTLECWTNGDSIGNDTLWLRTSDGCYVDDYDLTAINGSYQDILSYCGSDSEVENLTYEKNVVKYDSECRLCPVELDCDVTAYLGIGTEIITTCWTDEGMFEEFTSIWLKTTGNCYVSQDTLEEPADKSILDNCGPQMFLMINDTLVGRSPDPEPEPEHHISLRESAYLTNLTVGVDSTNCYKTWNTTKDATVDKVYTYNEEVWVFCYLEPDWLLSTDYCWVNGDDFWQSIDDDYEFPLCSDFEKENCFYCG